MDFVKVRRPFSTDAEGNIESCLIYTDRRVVKAFDNVYMDEVGIVYPSYEVDI